MTLTVLQIKHAPQGMHADGNGLYLRAHASGSKSWIFRFQLNGKRREMGLGTLGHVSPVEARNQAAHMSALVHSGIDPIEHRNQKEAEAIEATTVTEARTITFARAAEEYIAIHKAGWKNKKHAPQWANTLIYYAYPIIGNKPVSEVDTEDVLKILAPIWTTKTETASRVRSRIELVLSFAKARKWRQGENPAMWRGNLDAIFPSAKKVKKVIHYPALPYIQITAFMAELKQIQSMGARALEFAILTAARSSEVCFAKWHEVDLTAKLWTIPAERMKAEREHWVPLSMQAIRLIESLPQIEGSPYLFPNCYGDNVKPLSNTALLNVIRKMNACRNAPWIDPTVNRIVTVHGFRSTFRDWCAEVSNCPREVAEHALAHRLPDRAEAAYQRGTMLERRAPLMQSWADYIDTGTQ
jgi:integrase